MGNGNILVPLDRVEDVEKKVDELNSDLGEIGKEYYSNALLTTSISSNVNTNVLTKTGIPKGKYMVSAQVHGSTLPTGGGLIGIELSNGVVKGCNSIPIYNNGFYLNAGITTIVEVTADNGSINVVLYPKDNQTLTQGRLSIVRIV